MELHRERQLIQLVGQPGVKSQYSVADPHPGVTPLNQVEGSRHDAHVDPLLGGAALDVADVALQGEQEPLPRGVRVQGCQHPTMGNEAQRRAVRRSPVVVGDVLARQVGGVVVPQPLEKPPQLVASEQEEEHHRVGLLGQLVAVRVVALGAQDPVEPLDVAVLGAVGLPVKLRKLFVSLELTDDAVAMEGDEHPPAHLLPFAQFVVAQAESGAQRLGPALRQQREHLSSDIAQPGHHHIGVGVVAQSALLGVRVLLVELVRPHDAVDLVAPSGGVEVRNGRPEARDFQQQCRTVVTQEGQVLRDYGAELLLEIARFWASIAHFNPTRGRYEIHGVMGPDEFHEKYPDAEQGGLRNNAYTTVMVAWLCDVAGQVLSLLPESRAEALRARLGLRDDELRKWQEMSRRMFVPFHGDGIISQFEGYEELAELDWEAYRAKYGNIQRLDRILRAEGDDPDRYKLAKQADTVMLFF